MRVVQPEGSRGSLKWIQKSVAADDQNWLPKELRGTKWVSPLLEDEWAEYRDGSFLARVGQNHLRETLADFWPMKGPQWDALGTLDGVPVLVEAKAHVGEFFSPATQARTSSRERIEKAFEIVAPAFGSDRAELWTNIYFQYANRLAHLWFFHEHGLKAHLLFVSYLDDVDMNGPSSAETWKASFEAADYALGIKRNKLSSGYVHHTTPSVKSLGDSELQP